MARASWCEAQVTASAEISFGFLIFRVDQAH
jgi:hypothetical protein